MNQIQPKPVNAFLDKHPLKTIVFENKQIEYISTGRGKRAVLLLPGGGQTAQSNFGLIEALEQSYKVLSPTVYDVDSIDQFCRIINRLLDLEKIKAVNIYGLSVGGLIAQAYFFRYPNQVENLILSHACTPNSTVFKNKVVRPLQVMNVILPIIPLDLIKHITKRFAGKAQGVAKNNSQADHWIKDSRNQVLSAYFAQDWFDKYLDKTLIKTWINLDVGYSKEKFDINKVSGWQGRIMILSTDNDPLIGVDKNYKSLYPQAQMHVFHATGHLTFHYQFTKIKDLVIEFLEGHNKLNLHHNWKN